MTDAPTGGSPTAGSPPPDGSGDWIAAGASSAIFYNGATYATGALFSTGGSGASFVGSGTVVSTTYAYVFENIIATDTVTPPSAAGVYVITNYGETIKLTQVSKTALGVHMAQGVTFGATASFVWTPGGDILEAIKLTDSAHAAVYMHASMTEDLRILQRQVVALLAHVTETMVLTPLAEAYVGTVMLNRLLLTDAANARVLYAVAMTEAIEVAETYHRFIGGMLDETVLIGDAATERYKAVARISEFLTLGVAQSYVMAFRLTIRDGVAMSDETALAMIYSEQMTEVIDLEILYQSPNGNVTSWAINTRTGAVTEYQGWSFNSFVEMNGRYVGANQDGLFELNGPTDNGLNVIADIVGGMLQPGGPHLAGLKGVYLGQTGQGYWLLKIETGDGREYVYQRLSNPAMMTTKFTIGKGINARYIGWELINVEGQDFDIDTIEFMPMLRSRRI